MKEQYELRWETEDHFITVVGSMQKCVRILGSIEIFKSAVQGHIPGLTVTELRPAKAGCVYVEELDGVVDDMLDEGYWL